MSLTATQAAEAEAPEPPRTAPRRRWVRTLPFLLPLAAFAVLVLTGVTTSNIGAPGLREDPSAPHGLQIGDSQEVRSDEFMTESPIWLGQIAIGPGQAVNPLNAPPNFFAQLPSGPVSSIVFFDGTVSRLGPWVPDAMLFAFKWWLPTLLLVIGMPLWFRLVTGSWRWGYLAAFLCLLAPASMWWSGRPINTLGFMFAGCALGIVGADQLGRRRWVRFVLCMLAAGVLIARFPTYYQPLAIVLGFPVILATAAFLLVRRRPWRDRLIALFSLGLSSAELTGLLIWENLPAIRAGLETVYPGERKSTGLTIFIGRIFGSTDLGFLKTTDEGMTGSNPSEVSSAFTVLLAVLLVLVVAERWRGRRTLAAATIPVAALALFWLSWCTLSYGGLGLRIPLANLVPYSRAANGVGFLAILAFCLYMTQWQRPSRVITAIGAGALAAFLSAWAGSSLQQDAMPMLSSTMIWASSVVTGAVIAALVWWPHHRATLIVAGVAAGLLTYSATPILVGLGDLRGTNASQLFIEKGAQSRETGSLWASNSIFVDALMFATGTPSLSSRQQIGPNRDEWLKLDPGGGNEGVWNRGGSYITFDWTSQADVQFANPNPDIVMIRTSPCTLASRIPELRYVVSTTPLSDSCLVQTGSFQWSGLSQTIYEVRK